MKGLACIAFRGRSGRLLKLAVVAFGFRMNISQVFRVGKAGYKYTGTVLRMIVAVLSLGAIPHG